MFANFNQEEDFIYGEKGGNCNIVFGFNGSGKTTITNAISFFSDNSFLTEDEKKEIYRDLQISSEGNIELSLQGKSTIKYPASSEHSKNICVFNPNFVSTHVFDGTKGKIRKFSNIGGSVSNPAIDKINKELEEKIKQKKDKNTENEKLEKEQKKITQRRSNDFSKTLTDKNKRITAQNLSSCVIPDESLDDLKEKIKALSVDYELSKKQAELSNDIDSIEQKKFTEITFDTEPLESLLKKNIQHLSKDVLERKIKKIQTCFEDESYKQSVEKWFRFGKEILSKTASKEEIACPVCDSDITQRIDNLLKDYDGYFEKTYEDFIEEITSKTKATSDLSDEIQAIKDNSSELEKIYLKYADLFKDISFKNYKFSNVETDLKRLKKDLKNKSENIQKQPSVPENLAQEMASLNSFIKDIEKTKDEMLQILKSKELNTNQVEDKIRDAYKKIILLEFNESVSGDRIKEYKDNITQINQIENDEIPRLKRDLSNELKEIKAESRNISKYLEKMGIDHFDIDINEDKEEENIIVKYKKTGQEKKRLKNTLSDGERTALAFAYFLSKFECEINTEAKQKEAVVIIDDPISSLDENRLYSTASLIDKNFGESKQVIVFSHNFLFLKYYNSLAKKPKTFFLNNDKLTILPEEMKNFETPYFYMLRCLLDFLDENNKDITYNESKKYLPNFIRRILETFLSFKFSLVSGKRKSYSPGLGEFEDKIDETDIKDTTKGHLKDKIREINKICDAHSHGNAQHTQENFYISEDDLHQLAKNTLFVIETMCVFR